MIRISLKEVSLEEVTDRDYAQLRRRFLKDAKKHYSREAWSDGYLRTLAGLGAGLGIGGAALYNILDSEWCLIPALVGVVNMGQAYMKKRLITGACVDALDKRTAGISYEELERRVNDCDYDVPGPSEDEMKQMSMDLYAMRVMDAVAQKDVKFPRYPWSGVGMGIAGFGAYQAASDNPVAGGFTIAAGSIVFLISSLMKRRKIANIAKKAKAYLDEKGYNFFDNYVRKKDPYVFWQVNVLGNRDFAG
ncbi:hypothetical protein KY359_03610 [Candidatus Woesearchaeota archaeon]|nr:hypothetical protein [Candidatus Woesearchaeota archaeon]